MKEKTLPVADKKLSHTTVWMSVIALVLLIAPAMLLNTYMSNKQKAFDAVANIQSRSDDVSSFVASAEKTAYLKQTTYLASTDSSELSIKDYAKLDDLYKNAVQAELISSNASGKASSM